MSIIDGLELSKCTGKVASDPNETREDYIARMELEGYVPSYPAANELQIDIDNNTHFDAWERSAAIFFREIPEATWEENESKSGLPGRHIRVRLPFEVSDIERIAWQAALGSDSVRELLSCLRCLRGDEHPTLFIEKKS